MRSVEASASTREEAIQNALQELGVEMYEVDKIDILDEGSKGLLGFGARPVKVRVTVENLPEQPSRPRQKEAPRREPAQQREPGAQREAGREARGGRGNNRNDGRAENRPQRPEGRRDSRNENRDRADRPQQSARPERNDRPERKERPPRPPREERPARNVEEEEVAPLSDAQGKEAAALLQEIITRMDIEANVEFHRSEDGSARLNVSAEDSALLIGRKGSNLNAMQYVVNRMISRGDTNENSERIVVDVEGYVDRRRESLTEMALSMADKAKSTRRNMRLKPMSPQERRIIHVALQDDPDIRTFSLGESLYRSVIISPKDARDERPPRGGRGRRSNGGGRGGNNSRGGRPRSGNPTSRRDYEPDPGQFGD